jgi:hypothetical protein
MRNLFITVSFFLLSVYAGKAQTISNDRLKELLRSSQLLGSYKPGNSLSVNANLVNVAELDSALDHQKYSPVHLKIGQNAAISFLPASITQQYNSQTPYDWNNGPMIPARGYQSVMSLGAFATVGRHITIQIAPEFVSAENKPFETFSQELGDAAWTSYYKFLNTTDIPEQFGTKPYRKILAGQSSIRYHTDQFSFGLSTENLWWGPGYRNALVMSTNAPGFLHATINTVRPVETAIGKFEGQIIAGTLSNSGILPPRINSIDPQGNFVYQPKKEDTRYITGMVLSWQPKWTPNLFLGIAKASYLYASDLSNPIDALPFQGFFGRAITANEGNGKKSSMGSLFFRYVMPKEHAEIYLELGRKDISLMPWNIVQNQQYRRAYVTGIRKVFDSKNNSHIQLAAELTQMQAPTADLIHQPDSWYTDQYIRQGYTNMGKSIGAGIGPGSNSQTLEISWIRGLKKIGLQFERLRHNSDFYYYAFERLGDFRRHWIDISTTLKADWNYKNIFFSGQFAVVRSYNYEWLIVQYIPDYFVPGNEVLNFSGKLAVSYRF